MTQPEPRGLGRAQPACMADPTKWELDREGEHLLGEWAQAIETCISCPFQAACREELDRYYPEWWDSADTAGAPYDIIWAGWAFSSVGQVLTQRGLRRLASERRAAARRRTIAEHRATLEAAAEMAVAS